VIPIPSWLRIGPRPQPTMVQVFPFHGHPDLEVVTTIEILKDETRVDLRRCRLVRVITNGRILSVNIRPREVAP